MSGFNLMTGLKVKNYALTGQNDEAISLFMQQKKIVEVREVVLPSWNEIEGSPVVKGAQKVKIHGPVVLLVIYYKD